MTSSDDFTALDVPLLKLIAHKYLTCPLKCYRVLNYVKGLWRRLTERFKELRACELSIEQQRIVDWVVGPTHSDQ